jgi:hypothetical protein
VGFSAELVKELETEFEFRFELGFAFELDKVLAFESDNDLSAVEKFIS